MLRPTEIKETAPPPVWSVMLPTYRPREDYLAQTLHSVLRQGFDSKKMHIEVIDDASPDVSVPELVRSIAGNRVTVRVNQTNLGLAGCWNECIRRAEGSYVHLLHQDDIVLPGFYSALATGFQNPSVGAAFCRHVIMDEDGHWQSLSPLESKEPRVLDNFISTLASSNRLQCPSVAVRKTVYSALGFFNSAFKHTLDWEMWMRIASKYSMYYDPGVLACYRMHSSSMTSRQQRTAEALTDIFAALKHFSVHLDNGESRLARARYAMDGLAAVDGFINSRDNPAALANLRVVLKNCWTLPVLRRSLRMLAKLVLKQLHKA